GGAFFFFPPPARSGARSASVLRVFWPPCPPPLSRNIAKATAISAPRMAPSVPFRALLLSLIINSDHSDSRPTPVPDRGSCGGCARAQLRQPCGAWPKHLTKVGRDA